MSVALTETLWFEIASGDAVLSSLPERQRYRLPKFPLGRYSDIAPLSELVRGWSRIANKPYRSVSSFRLLSRTLADGISDRLVPLAQLRAQPPRIVVFAPRGDLEFICFSLSFRPKAFKRRPQRNAVTGRYHLDGRSAVWHEATLRVQRCQESPSARHCLRDDLAKAGGIRPDSIPQS